MNKPHSTSVRGLGEIALRVDDLDRMQAFYKDVVGLELMDRFENAVFFRIAEGFGAWNYVRLPFQGVFIAWAWWYTHPDDATS